MTNIIVIVLILFLIFQMPICFSSEVLWFYIKMEFIFSYPVSPCGWRPDKCPTFDTPCDRHNLVMSSKYFFVAILPITG